MSENADSGGESMELSDRAARAHAAESYATEPVEDAVQLRTFLAGGMRDTWAVTEHSEGKAQTQCLFTDLEAAQNHYHDSQADDVTLEYIGERHFTDVSSQPVQCLIDGQPIG